MKNSYPGIRKHAISFSTWVVIFITALALHAILFSLFRPLQDGVAESSRNDRYTVFIEENDLTAVRSDPHKLRYWLRYMDPERVLKSDPDSGFSMFGGKMKVSMPDPAGFPHSLFRFSPEAESQPFPPIRERTLSDHVRGVEAPVMFSASVPKPQAETAARYPIWTDDSGTVFSGLFYPDKDSLRILETEHSAKPTLLRLQVPRDGIPFVKILRSSGNVRLDMLAVRQLKIRKENFTAGTEPTVKYFMVSWQSPDHDSILKGKNL